MGKMHSDRLEKVYRCHDKYSANFSTGIPTGRQYIVRNRLELDVVVHAFNLSTWETKTEVGGGL